MDLILCNIDKLPPVKTTMIEQTIIKLDFVNANEFFSLLTNLLFQANFCLRLVVQFRKMQAKGNVEINCYSHSLVLPKPAFVSRSPPSMVHKALAVA